MENSPQYVIEMLHITKEFPGIKANDDITLQLRKGEIHALLGENGAGKSTLMKIINGTYVADEGEMFYKGEKIGPHTVQDTLKMGIAMIYQELNPVLEMTIAENIWLGREPRKGRFVDFGKMQKDTQELLDKLGEIKRHNKQRLADYIKAHNGIEVNMDSIFDVQVKRLHEYKRQMLNILHIISLYHKLKDNPDMDFVPRTFIFGSKAAPGYAVAKKTIQLINSISKMIDNDPAVRDKLKVVFLEDYKVSLAEIIMPAAEVSEQISIAGKEASGTGNMKFMMNGALTIGTMDGANVEICEAVGKENIFIFGMETPEAEALAASGSYEPMVIYQNDPVIRRVLDQMIHGFGDGVDYTDIANLLLHGGNGGPADRYMSLKDFASYAAAQERVSEVYRDQDQWNRMALINIANSGRFAADRSIAEYAQNIWRVKTNFAF